jgi:hypothetical protein
MNRYDDVHLYVATLLKQQDASLAPVDPSARSGDGLEARSAGSAASRASKRSARS